MVDIDWIREERGDGDHGSGQRRPHVGRGGLRDDVQGVALLRGLQQGALGLVGVEGGVHGVLGRRRGGGGELAADGLRQR